MRMDTMTPRRRWLAALRMEPVDRLPFWPKLDGAYPPWRKGRFEGKSVDELHAWIGSDKLVWLGRCTRDVRKRTAVETRGENGIQRTVFRAPGGQTELVNRWDEPSHAWHPIAFPVRTLEDLEIVRECFVDCTVELDPEALARTQARVEEVGEDGATDVSIGESPLMCWVEWLAGVENAHYLLADHREEVETLFDAVHAVLLRRAAILCDRSPSDMLSMTENTSTTLISPEQYRRYCARHVAEYGRIAREAGRLIYLHMCGCLKALLGDLARIPVDAFEAFTSPPVGDTTLLDGRTACPDKCLIGGTSATLWTRPADQIGARIEADLDALPHHRGVVVTSAGVMPPMCEPETIKQVCERVKGYKAEVAL